MFPPRFWPLYRPAAAPTPQAALEQAAVDLLRDQLGYADDVCDRSFDGRPPAKCGRLYVAVWSDAARTSGSRVSLDERFGIAVTVTVRVSLPLDRAWLERDRLEAEMNRVRALLHGDTWGHALRRAANVLAGMGGAAEPVGFTEALWLTGVDAWQVQGGDWFFAQDQRVAGVSQTCRFGGARMVQSVPTAR